MLCLAVALRQSSSSSLAAFLLSCLLVLGAGQTSNSSNVSNSKGPSQLPSKIVAAGTIPTELPNSKRTLLSRRRLEGLDVATIENLRDRLHHMKTKEHTEAVESAIKSLDKTVSIVKSCMGKGCSGVEVGKGLFDVVGELGPMIQELGSIGSLAGPWFPIVSLIGSLCMGLFGGSESAGIKPLTVSDIKSVVGEVLYDFALDQTNWQFQTLLSYVQGRAQLYSSVKNAAQFNSWYDHVWSTDAGVIQTQILKIVEGYDFLVGNGGSFRALQLADKIMFQDDCDATCSYLDFDNDSDFHGCDLDKTCIEDLNKGTEKWKSLKSALKQFQKLVVAFNVLKSQVSTILSYNHTRTLTGRPLSDYDKLAVLASWGMLKTRGAIVKHNLDRIANCAKVNEDTSLFDQHCWDRSEFNKAKEEGCNYAGGVVQICTLSDDCNEECPGWVELWGERRFNADRTEGDCKAARDQINKVDRFLPFYKVGQYPYDCGECIWPNKLRICAAPVPCMNCDAKTLFTSHKEWEQ